MSQTEKEKLREEINRLEKTKQEIAESGIGSYSTGDLEVKKIKLDEIQKVIDTKRKELGELIGSSPLKMVGRYE